MCRMPSYSCIYVCVYALYVSQSFHVYCTVSCCGNQNLLAVGEKSHHVEKIIVRDRIFMKNCCLPFNVRFFGLPWKTFFKHYVVWRVCSACSALSLSVKHFDENLTTLCLQQNQLLPRGKLQRNLPVCFCFHIFAMARTCIFFSIIVSHKNAKVNQQQFISQGNSFRVF